MSTLIDIRRIQTSVEEIFHEFGPLPGRTERIASVCAVLTNPYSGRYEPDIMPMMEALNPLGVDMAQLPPQCDSTFAYVSCTLQPACFVLECASPPSAEAP